MENWWQKLRQEYYFSDLSIGTKLLVVFVAVLFAGFTVFYSIKSNLDIEKLTALVSGVETSGPVAVISNPDTTQPQWHQTNNGNFSLVKGYAPFPVFLEGWQSSPRADIVEYEWNFNDPSAYEGNPNILKTFNGAHVYEKPGTYTATLKVTDKNGKTGTATISINVVDRSQPLEGLSTTGGKTYYVDSVAGNDTNDGLSPGTAWKSADKAFGGLAKNYYRPGDSVLFKRGQTFDFVNVGSAKTAPIRGGHNSILFSAYGSGAKPVFQYKGSKGGEIFPISGKISGLSFVDLVFKMGSPLKDAEGEPYMASLVVALSGNKNILFFRSEGYDAKNSFIGANGSKGSEPLGIFIIDSKVANTEYTAPYASTPIYIRGHRFAALNSSFDLSGNHEMYLKYLDKAVLAHNTYTRPAFGRTAVRIDGEAFDTPANNIHLYGNKFLGWRDNLDNLGGGRAGGSHNGGGRWNYSIVEIAPNVKFDSRQDLFLNTVTNTSSYAFMGSGQYAGQKISIKVNSISLTANEANLSLLDQSKRVLETKTVPEDKNLRQYFTSLATNVQLGDLGTSNGTLKVSLYYNPSLQSMNDVIFERNIVTNAEKLLTVAIGDNIIIRNNLFVSPSTYDPGVAGRGRIEIGHRWEWRPVRNLTFVGNTIVTKASNKNNQAIVRADRYRDHWSTFFFDSRNPYGNQHQNITIKNNILAVDPGTNGGKAAGVYLSSIYMLPVVNLDNNAYYSPGNSSTLFRVYDKYYSLSDWQKLTLSGSNLISASSPVRDSKSFEGNPNLVSLSVDDSAVLGGPTLSTLLAQSSSYLAGLKPIYNATANALTATLANVSSGSTTGSVVGGGVWSADSYFDLLGLRRAKSVDIGAFQVTPFDETAPSTSVNPASGSYTSAQTISFSVSEPAVTYYCLGESCEPTQVYSSSTPVQVSSSGVIRYYSQDIAGNKEEIKSAVYTIGGGDQPTGPVFEMSMNSVTDSGASCPTDKCPQIVSGKVGSSALFNGSSYLQIPNKSELNPTYEMSLSVWVKPDGWATGNRRVLQKGMSDNQYRLTTQNGVLLLQFAGLSQHILSTSVPSDGVWHHIAGVYNRKTREFALYVDGSKVASKLASGNILTTSDPLYIGAKKPDGIAKDFFKGEIDEIKIYNRALTETEISALAK